MHVAIFLSEGRPHDRGKPLGRQRAKFLAANSDKIVHDYNPRKLARLGVRTVAYNSTGLNYGHNPRIERLGNLGSRPFIMLDAMRHMRDGETLMYVDANRAKYGQPWNISVDPIVQRCAAEGLPLCIARQGCYRNAAERAYFGCLRGKQLAVAQHVKTNVVRELAHSFEFAMAFPLLIGACARTARSCTLAYTACRRRVTEACHVLTHDLCVSWWCGCV
jgi:hypothetical protein